MLRCGPAAGGIRIILITGTPGTGKTTIARMLADRLGAPHIDMAKEAARHGVVERYDPERNTYIVNPRRLRMLLEVLVAGYEGAVVVDGHIVDAVPKEVVEKVIVLRLHPLKLKERLESLGWPKPKVKENVEAEVLDCVLQESIRAHGSDKVLEIDTTGRSPSEAFELVLNALREPEGFGAGKVDWISRMASEGSLDEFVGYVLR